MSFIMGLSYICANILYSNLSVLLRKEVEYIKENVNRYEDRCGKMMKLSSPNS